MTTAPTNQLFSFTRWRLLLAKHWIENRRRYILSLLAIGGLLTIWCGFLIIMDAYAPLDVNMQFAAYFVGLFLTGALYSSMLFADLGTKKEALPWLSLPASHLEKLLCALLFGTFLFFIAYTLVFYLVDIPMVEWANSILRNHPRNWPNTNIRIPPVSIYNIFTGDGAPIPEKEDHLFLSFYFAVQAAFLLGSIYFPRYAFIKTVVAVVLFTLGFIVFQRGVIYPLLPTGWYNNFFRWSTDLYESGPPKSEVRLPLPIENLLTLLGQIGLPPFFWFVTYIRLKEKEV
ncbi:MAG TPA: hypothetical protein VKQ52_22195 [Puia sp.]|nr:hypothetical protein [Puia sp.]